MKIGYLFMAIIIGNYCSVSAQSKFSIGPTAGFGLSSISNVSNSKSKLSGNAGLSFVYSAVEHFGIGADVKYSFEGTRVEYSGSKIDFDLNYVRIPVKAIYFFNKYGDKLRPKIFAGPSFGFLTTAKADGVSNKEDYDSFDLGLLFGAGLNYKLVNKTWFNVDVTYNNGLSDVTKNTILNDDKNANRNLQLNVGVNFGL